VAVFANSIAPPWGTVDPCFDLVIVVAILMVMNDDQVIRCVTAWPGSMSLYRHCDIYNPVTVFANSMTPRGTVDPCFDLVIVVAILMVMDDDQAVFGQSARLVV